MGPPAALGGACSEPGERPLRVASKAFTESVLLGEIAAQAARAAGTPVVHRRALGGTRLVWNALLAGEIDVYPEYTGTLDEEILRVRADPRDRRLPEAALRAQGLGAIGPLGFSNSYALGMRETVAERLGIRTISDLVGHPGLRFGLSSEFMSRRDGWPALRDRYRLPQRDVRSLDHDVAYRGLASDAVDLVDLYTTDAEIRSLDLRVLADDLGYFPPYDAVLLHRLDAAAAWPQAFAMLARLEGAISVEAMRRMNGRAKIDRQPEAVIAAEQVQATLGTAAPPPAPASRWSAVARRAREHLLLVALSLAAAVALAIPLGVVAWRVPRLGQVVLGSVGVVQTIPTLALLVFMVPLLGLGAGPAIVALFLYSLLPIVRNTHAGLASIPGHVRESAQALGLPGGAVLRLVELPLASRSILAGIKSAAVINVGTATLGALVGAGGLGEPIFTGVRLADVGLILEGAVPASLLALGAQGLFDLLERTLVPRGLRLPPRA
jgi:osmoprotectant transport system permease protein